MCKAKSIPDLGWKKGLRLVGGDCHPDDKKIDEGVKSVARFWPQRRTARKPDEVQLPSRLDVKPLAESFLGKSSPQKVLAESRKLLRGNHLKERHLRFSRTARA